MVPRLISGDVSDNINPSREKGLKPTKVIFSVYCPKARLLRVKAPSSPDLVDLTVLPAGSKRMIDAKSIALLVLPSTTLPVIFPAGVGWLNTWKKGHKAINIT